ncbi:BnaCnng62830D [Brassica napus]|uniref:ATP-dependent Clp protease proteolytic subunit n=2 Tax=Brassica TaxID=3705 RepID=A0A078JP28_BRANA|nr:BnaCnng62830D [Brassica napus]VDD29265.1 unnamed protein product [Brassica oleracea]
MSSSDVVAQSAFDVLRLGRSSQFIVARLLRFWTPKTSRSMVNSWESLYSSYTSISQCSSSGIVQGKRVGHGTLMKSFSNQILATMLYLDTLDDSRRIYMYLNGPGGDLTPSLAIYDTMKSLKSFLLAAAEKGQRFAMPLLRIALQSPAGAARGQADDIQNEANLRKRIFKDLSRLKRFNSEEAIEYGLIIVRPPRIKDDVPLQDETSGLG